jgi:hypothetical protein
MVVAHPVEPDPWEPERDLHPARTVAAGRHRDNRDATRVAFGDAGPRALHDRDPESSIASPDGIEPRRAATST